MQIEGRDERVFVALSRPPLVAGVDPKLLMGNFGFVAFVFVLFCLATQFPWTRSSRICVSPLRIRRLASTLHPAPSLRPAFALLPWPSLASAAG